jgi:hypothetical protein
VALLEFESAAALVSYLNDARHAELGRLFWEYSGNSVIAEAEWADLDSPGVVDQLAE